MHNGLSKAPSEQDREQTLNFPSQNPRPKPQKLGGRVCREARGCDEDSESRWGPSHRKRLSNFPGSKV